MDLSRTSAPRFNLKFEVPSQPSSRVLYQFGTKLPSVMITSGAGKQLPALQALACAPLQPDTASPAPGSREHGRTARPGRQQVLGDYVAVGRARVPATPREPSAHSPPGTRGSRSRPGPAAFPRGRAARTDGAASFSLSRCLRDPRRNDLLSQA